MLRGSNETLGPEDESYHVVSFTPTINTNTSKTNGLTVVSLEEYKISNSMVFSYSPAIIDVDLEIVIKYNNVSIYTEEYTLKGSINPFQIIRKQYDATFNHTPTVVGNYALEIRKKPTFASISVEVENISFSITGLTVVSKPVRTYAQLVDKMLRNTEYVLSPSSRSRLFLTAPENKYEGYMLFDALQKIGGEVGALVRITAPINKRYWGELSAQQQQTS